MSDNIICIFGATGFVGSSLLEKLSESKYEIRVFTRVFINNIPNRIKQFHGSPLISDNLIPFLSGCSVIYNCAGSYSNKDDINIELPKLIFNVLNKLDELHEVHFIQLSSVGVYGLSNSSVSNLVTELSIYQPKNAYEYSKLEADKFIINSTKNSRVNFTILRPTNVIGKKMKNDSFRQFISAASTFYYFKVGFKKTIANYIHINDVVTALILVMGNKSAFNEIFIISNDMYLEDIVKVIRREFNIYYPIFSIPKFFLILLITFLGGLFKLPLTISRIHALSNLTSYSSHKISAALNFSPQFYKEFMVMDMLNN